MKFGSMKAKGIRIPDKKNHIICVELCDILETIMDGNTFYWSILFLEVTGHLGENISVPVLEEQILEMERGLFITWEDLNSLASKIDQTIWITLIGCKDEKILQRYEEDQDMYETCDITIEMHDSCYWEVFSKDESLIARLAKKFKDTKFLEPDFQK
jgi:hypothetical protein